MHAESLITIMFACTVFNSKASYSCYLPQEGSVPFQVPFELTDSRIQALSDDPPTSWYPGEQL